MEESNQPFPDDIVERLVAAHDKYQHTVSEFYDDVLHEVTDRVAAADSVGKADIGALVFWKRCSSPVRGSTAANGLLRNDPERDRMRQEAGGERPHHSGQTSTGNDRSGWVGSDS